MKLHITIPRLMKERGLTLSKLSSKTGIPKTSLHSIINGKGQKSANMAHIKNISETFNVSFHELIFDEPDKNESSGTETLTDLFEGDVRLIIRKIERKK